MDGATPGRQPRESIPDPVAPPHHTQCLTRDDLKAMMVTAELCQALDEFEEVVAARARYCYPHQHANPSNPGDAAMAAHLAIRRHAARRRVLEIANG